MLYEGILLLSLNLIAATGTFSLERYEACLEEPLVDKKGRYFPNHTKIDGRSSKDCHGDGLIELHKDHNGGLLILGNGKFNGSIVHSGYTNPGGWSEGEDVAVKSTVVSVTVENPTPLERFRREICLLNNISHPSIPPLRCAYVKAPWFFKTRFTVKLVMPKISGENLKSMSEQQLRNVNFKALFEAIVGLFTFLHSFNISYNGNFFQETVIYNCRGPSAEPRVMFTGWSRVVLVKDSGDFTGIKVLDWTAVKELLSQLHTSDILTESCFKEIQGLITQATLENNNSGQ